MANTQAMCNSFKGEILTGTAHNLNSNSLKAALYLTTATINASTTVYSATNEVSSAGYTAAGVAVTNGTVALTTNTQYWTPTASFAWTGVTFTTDCVLVHNVTLTKAIAVYTFGSQTVTAGNFTLTMPTNAAGTALINLT